MIEIYHLIYFREGVATKITYRKNWDFKRNTQKINKTNLWINYKFQDFLIHCFDKWFELNERAFIQFTIGIDKESKIETLAVQHPRDNYNKKIGRNIVEGRIKRQRGELDGRYKYFPLPNYIYDPSVEK